MSAYQKRPAAPRIIDALGDFANGASYALCDDETALRVQFEGAVPRGAEERLRLAELMVVAQGRGYLDVAFVPDPGMTSEAWAAALEGEESAHEEEETSA